MGRAQDGLTEYERQREEHIARNKARMDALNLPDLSTKVTPTRRQAAHRPTSSRGTRASRRVSHEPSRRSLRVAGLEAAANEVKSEGPRGAIVTSMTVPDVPRERHPQGDLEFDAQGDRGAQDVRWLPWLSTLGAAVDGRGSGKRRQAVGVDVRHTTPWVRDATLREQDVLKVVHGACVHLGFHPTESALVVAAADKYGAVALWDVDAACPHASRSDGHSAVSPRVDGVGSSGAGVEEAAEEGVEPTLSLDYHRQYVCGLKWVGSGGSARLFTASYDGSLRAFDAGGGGRAVLVHSSEEEEYSCMDVSARGDCALLGTNVGELTMVDARARRAVFSGVDIAERKVNTVQLEPGAEGLVVTASTDTSVKIWDLRRAGPRMKPLARGGHTHTCQAAHFAPDGSCRVVSTSYDDTIRVWDGASLAGGNLTQLRAIPHNNHTGRWVLPFRAIWSPASDRIAVGNMTRKVDILDATSGALDAQLFGDAMTAIASRSAFHPTLPVLAAATNSGRLHVYR